MLLPSKCFRRQVDPAVSEGDPVGYISRQIYHGLSDGIVPLQPCIMTAFGHFQDDNISLLILSGVDQIHLIFPSGHCQRLHIFIHDLQTQIFHDCFTSPTDILSSFRFRSGSSHPLPDAFRSRYGSALPHKQKSRNHPHTVQSCHPLPRMSLL